MKGFFYLMNVAVFFLVLGVGEVRAQPPIIDTDRSMYNLDPYYWVCDASQYQWQGVNQNLWPAEGHDVTVGFSLAGITGGAYLTFTVEGLEEPLVGLMEEDQENGVYRGSFVVSEAGVGGVLFKPGETDEQGGIRRITATPLYLKAENWGLDMPGISVYPALIVVVQT